MAMFLYKLLSYLLVVASLYHAKEGHLHRLVQVHSPIEPTWLVILGSLGFCMYKTKCPSTVENLSEASQNMGITAWLIT